jgi:heme exporter protein D
MQRLTVFVMTMLLVSTVQAEDIILQTLLGTGYREQELQMAKGTIF